MSFIGTGVIVGGKLQVRNREAFEKAIAQMKDGEVTVIVEPCRATRSVLQNSWYWSQVVGLVAEHTGYTPNEVHDIYKAKFLPKRLAMAKRNGEIVDEFVIGGSTTKLNKLEFGEYCEAIRAWARDDLGVVIPDPDQDYWVPVPELYPSARPR